MYNDTNIKINIRNDEKKNNISFKPEKSESDTKYSDVRLPAARFGKKFSAIIFIKNMAARSTANEFSTCLLIISRRDRRGGALIVFYFCFFYAH